MKRTVKLLENRIGGTIAIVLLLLVLGPYFMEPTTSVGTYKDAVSIFPQNAESKNYRLTATVKTTVHYGAFFTQTKEYQATHITWPNGGTVEINCGGPIEADGKAFCSVGDDYYDLELNDPDNYRS